MDFIAHLETRPGFLKRETGLLPGPLVFELGCYGDCLNAPVGEPIAGSISAVITDNTADVRNSDAKNYENGYITIVPMEADYKAGNYRRYKSMVRGLNY